jgi:putative FmdB family regulatory protein
MPIYEYKCSSCGQKKEVLQKLSDAPLTQCPACGKATLNKLISAAGFHLKGSGWYATDFKGGASRATNEKDDAKPKDDKASKDQKTAEPAKTSSADKPKDETKAESPAKTASPADQ